MTTIVLITAVPTPGGDVSTKFRDGNDGSTPPTAPELNQPQIVSPTRADITMLTPPTGGTGTLTHFMQRSVLGEDQGFVDLTSGDLFAVDGRFEDTTLAPGTTYWWRDKVEDSAIPARASAYSNVVTATTPVVTGDIIKPSIPGQTTFIKVDSTTLQVGGPGSTDNVAVKDYDVLVGKATAGVPSDAGVVVVSPASFPVNVFNLDPGQQYYAKRRARDTSDNVSDYTDAVFQTTAATPGPRTGILATLDFSTFAADRLNPPQSAFPSAGIDHVDIRHIAQQDAKPNDFNVAACNAAGYNLLPHLEIIPAPASIGGRVARCTLYKSQVDYTTGSYQSFDKPRVDFRFNQLSMARDGEYKFAIMTIMGPEYVEDTVLTPEFLLQAHPGTPGASNNHFTLSIDGGAGGNATWTVKCQNHGNTSAAGTDPNPDQTAFKLQTPVLNVHKQNVPVFHVLWWKIDINNPAANFMRYYLTMPATSQQAATILERTGTRFGVQRAGGETIGPSVNDYKGGMRDDGSYGGIKTIQVISLGQIRFGSVSCPYDSIHPTRQAQP